MQTSLEFINNSDDSIVLSSDPNKTARENLIQLINTCGLIAFKDYYIKIKYGQITHIPDGFTKQQFLMLAKEVYESRAQRFERKRIK